MDIELAKLVAVVLGSGLPAGWAVYLGFRPVMKYLRERNDHRVFAAIGTARLPGGTTVNLTRSPAGQVNITVKVGHGEPDPPAPHARSRVVVPAGSRPAGRPARFRNTGRRPR